MSHGAIFPGGTPPGGLTLDPVAPTLGATSQFNTGTNPYTWNSETSVGPETYVLVYWGDSGGVANTLSTITWSGVGMTIDVQGGQSGGDAPGCAIAHVILLGAQSGDIVATFSGTVSQAMITIISLENLSSKTFRDTDSKGATSGTGTALSALTNPPSDGIILAAYANEVDTSAVTWTYAAEQDDQDGGLIRISPAWVLGLAAGNIIADGGSGRHHTVGISLR